MKNGKNSFSYDEYSEILKEYKGRFGNFKNINNDEFVILRHDVEFSIERAYDLAVFEKKHEVKSTYLFQVLSNAYNPFSCINRLKIEEIKNLGHEVGLHFYVSHLKPYDYTGLRSELKRQKDLFELALDFPCEIFSFHRPPEWVLELREDQINGIINTYGPSFFEFSPEPQKIKYIADSKHKWSYGHPLNYSSQRRIQILLHPDEWTINGDCSLEEFFKDLINHKTKIFKSTLLQETKSFLKIRDQLK